MKKALSLLLVLVLCLSLAACGVDEKYAPLLENLDANDYAGVKRELGMLSADFAAEQTQMTADAALLAKYQGLIAMLEAQDYENALQNILDQMPIPEEPVYTEIQITMDNWATYFEIRPYEHRINNAFGELQHIERGLAIYLREEYLELLKPQGADVSFKYAGTIAYAEANQDTCDFIEGGRLGDHTDTLEATTDVSDRRDWIIDETSPDPTYGHVAAIAVCTMGYGDGSGVFWGYFDTFDIVNVIGTLLLAE